MKCTNYHTKYFAYELTRRFPPDSVDKFASALVDAQVDLNPHQVDAALFAFQSPLSKGALLADEVGLGKTIEAGLVMAQKWAERKRRILIIVPANLRKQWLQELTQKFFLPCRILETASYNALRKEGTSAPFRTNEIVICSYAFARTKAEDIRAVDWHLVVIDEAHRLRNVYKPQNVVANALKTALAGRDKILLTATPLQNSLLELYGLVSIIDEHTFGDLKSFREQFANLSQQQTFEELKTRLKPLCHRTLRRQVLPYINYTRRLPMLEEFTPEDDEDRLYHLVSEYLQRENIQALPASQRSLTTLVMRKLLASSTFAIAGALKTISERLKARLRQDDENRSLTEELDQDYETLDETAEEWTEDETNEVLTPANRAALEQEIRDLDAFTALATSIQHNAKGGVLLEALSVAFAKAAEGGAARKAIIFTESRRTQEYLLQLLGASPFSEGLVLFNGTNTDARSKQIYQAWLQRHRDTDRVTGSKTADMRSALVDYFREEGQIMIATEAGAEGINLQFCSLVVNYDLPWNPQRIEQRIGRCHRYGQKHDVVVLNFLNRNNEADRRVFELLEQKFQLFAGVFGASDEILGAIESGVDFEKRIAGIYQQCRRPDEIATAFDQLQNELSHEINESMKLTRQQLLENFDDVVREKLKVRDETSKASLNRFEQLLMHLTRYELGDHARFVDDNSFRLLTQPLTEPVELGLYELPRRSGEAYLYRLAHPLAEALVKHAKTRDLPVAEVTFNYGEHEGKVSALESLVNKSGWLSLTQFSVETAEQGEDHLIFAACTDDGQLLDDDQASRLLTLPGCALEPLEETATPSTLKNLTRARQADIQRDVSERNAKFLEDETQKLDHWADDLKVGLEREIREFDRQIREARRAASIAPTLQVKLEGQKQVRALESQRNQKRRSLFDAQDEVDARREKLIEEVEEKLTQTASMKPVFTIRWSIR